MENDLSQMSTEEMIDALAPADTGEDERIATDTEAGDADQGLQAEVEQPGQVEPKAGEQTDATPETAAAAEVTQDPNPAADVVAAPAPVEQPQQPTGHDRAIVKAARAAEARANRALAAERRKNEELLAKLTELGATPAAAAAEKKPRAEVLEDVRQYAPEAGQYIEVLERQVEELKQAVPKPSAPAPEFTPDVLHDDPDIAAEIQADLDEVPEVSAWHVDPDQTNWTRAKAIEAMLVGSPKWGSRPLRERLVEVVRLRKEELADAGGTARDVSAGEVEPSAKTPKTVTKPTAEDARRVIEAKAKSAPVSASDIRGRSPPTRTASKRDAWHAMTNEQLLAQLPEIPE